LHRNRYTSEDAMNIVGYSAARQRLAKLMDSVVDDRRALRMREPSDDIASGRFTACEAEKNTPVTPPGQAAAGKRLGGIVTPLSPSYSPAHVRGAGAVTDRVGDRLDASNP
jgi:hypothetical protein